jgi:hypothetical protein
MDPQLSNLDPQPKYIFQLESPTKRHESPIKLKIGWPAAAQKREETNEERVTPKCNYCQSLKGGRIVLFVHVHFRFRGWMRGLLSGPNGCVQRIRPNKKQPGK